MLVPVGYHTFLFEPHQAFQLGHDLPGTMWPTAPNELEVLLQNLCQGLGKGTGHKRCLLAAMANDISTHPGLVPTTSPKVNHILLTPHQPSRGLQGGEGNGDVERRFISHQHIAKWPEGVYKEFLFFHIAVCVCPQRVQAPAVQEDLAFAIRLQAQGLQWPATQPLNAVQLHVYGRLVVDLQSADATHHNALVPNALWQNHQLCGPIPVAHTQQTK